MFTLMDIRDIAIQIERNGAAAYDRASEIAGDPDVAHLLRLMADQEKDHSRWFEQLKVPKALARGDRQILEMGRELLQNIMARQTFSLDVGRLADAQDIHEVLRQSREFENDTILFYEMLCGFLDDPVSVRQLERIIEEERVHIEQLEKMVADLDLPGRQAP